jgi:hypothetical protein
MHLTHLIGRQKGPAGVMLTVGEAGLLSFNKSDPLNLEIFVSHCPSFWR